MAQSHRKSFGAQRVMSPAIRARNIADSILLHRAEGHARTLAEYGIQDKPEMVALVNAILAQEEN